MRFLQYAADSSYIQFDQDPQNVENNLLSPVKLGPPRQLFQSPPLSPMMAHSAKTPVKATSSNPMAPTTDKTPSNKKRVRTVTPATPGLTHAMDEMSMEPSSPMKKPAPLQLDSSTIDLTEDSVNGSLNTSITAQSDKSIELTLGGTKAVEPVTGLEALFQEGWQEAKETQVQPTLPISQTQPYFGLSKVPIETILVDIRAARNNAGARRILLRTLLFSFAIIVSPNGTCRPLDLVAFFVANPLVIDMDLTDDERAHSGQMSLRRFFDDRHRPGSSFIIAGSSFEESTWHLRSKNLLVGLTNIVPEIWFELTGKQMANFPPDFPLHSGVLPPLNSGNSLRNADLSLSIPNSFPTPSADSDEIPESTLPLPSSSSIPPTLPMPSPTSSMPPTLPLSSNSSNMDFEDMLTGDFGASPTQPLPPALRLHQEPSFLAKEPSFLTKEASQLASQADYDDEPFLAQIGAKFRGKDGKASQRSSAPSQISQTPVPRLGALNATQKAGETSTPSLNSKTATTNSNAASGPSPSQLLASSHILKSVLSSDVSMSHSLVKSQQRKGFYAKMGAAATNSLQRTASQNRFYSAVQTKPERDSFQMGHGMNETSDSPLPSQLIKHVSHGRDEFDRLQMSMHYSLVGTTADQHQGVMEYDPDFEPYTSSTSTVNLDGAEIRSKIQDIVDLSRLDGADESVVDVDEFGEFGLNSQLPVNAQNQKSTMIWKDIEDADEVLGASRRDEIDEIVSSQGMSTPKPTDSRSKYATHIVDVDNIAFSQASGATQSGENTFSIASSRHRFMVPQASPAPLTPSPIGVDPNQRGIKHLGLQMTNNKAKLSAAKKKKPVRSNRSIYASPEYGSYRPSQSTQGQEDIDDDQVTKDESFMDVSISEQDPSRFETIEEFTAEDRRKRASASTMQYSPYQLVAEAHLKNSTDTLSMASTAPHVSPLPHFTSPTHATPNQRPASNPRAFLAPSVPRPVSGGFTPAPAMARPGPPSIGTLEWLQIYAPPMKKGQHRLALHSLPADAEQLPITLKLVLIGETMPRSRYTMALGYILSGAHANPQDSSKMVVDLTESSFDAPLVVAFLHFDGSFTPDPVQVPLTVSATSHLSYRYSNDTPVVWPFHQNPSVVNGQNVLNPITAPLLLVDRQTIVLKQSKKVLADLAPNHHLLDEFSNAVRIQPNFEEVPAEPLVKTNVPIIPPPINSTLTSSHGHFSAPTPAPSFPTPAAGAHAPIFARTRAMHTVLHHQHPLGFVGATTKDKLTAFVLAIFPMPFAPAGRGASLPIASVRLSSFSRSYSQTVATLEAAAKAKQDALFRRGAGSIQLDSVLQSRSVLTGKERQKVLAFVKELKMLVWIELEGADQIEPGQSFSLTNTTFVHTHAVSNPSLQSLAENSLEFLGIPLQDCVKSIPKSSRARALVAHAAALTTAPTYFPSSQDSEMDVDAPDSSYSAPLTRVSKREAWLSLASCSIPTLSIAKRNDMPLIVSRDMNDRMHIMNQSWTNYTVSRRLAVLGLVVIPDTSLPSQMIQVGRNVVKLPILTGKLAIHGAGNNIFEIKIPTHLLMRRSIIGPVFFDYLIQDGPSSFTVDGFTQMMMLVSIPTTGLPLRPLLRSHVAWGIAPYEVAVDGVIQFKQGTSMQPVREKFASILDRLREAAGPSSLGPHTLSATTALPCSTYRFGCPLKHENTVLLPPSWISNMFAPVEYPDRICFCRTCFKVTSAISLK
jgi:hypothetical protein